MGIFGWSLPPGCGSLPGEDDGYIFPEDEKVLALLEDAGVDSAVCAQVSQVIGELCASRAELHAALHCAVSCRLTVRFDATELSTTSGFGVPLASRDPEAAAAAFVELMRATESESSATGANGGGA